MARWRKKRRGRSVVLLAGALALMAFVGVWLRRKYWWVPGSLHDCVGHVLWAAGAFCVIGMVRRRWPTQWVGAVALALAFLMEFSQLWHVAPLNAARQTFVGRMLLGDVFRPSDLPFYALGAILAAGVDALLVRARR